MQHTSVLDDPKSLAGFAVTETVLWATAVMESLPDADLDHLMRSQSSIVNPSASLLNNRKMC